MINIILCEKQNKQNSIVFSHILLICAGHSAISYNIPSPPPPFWWELISHKLINSHKFNPRANFKIYSIICMEISKALGCENILRWNHSSSKRSHFRILSFRNECIQITWKWTRQSLNLKRALESSERSVCLQTRSFFLDCINYSS